MYANQNKNFSYSIDSKVKCTIKCMGHVSNLFTILRSLVPTTIYSPAKSVFFCQTLDPNYICVSGYADYHMKCVSSPRKTTVFAIKLTIELVWDLWPKRKWKIRKPAENQTEDDGIDEAIIYRWKCLHCCLLTDLLLETDSDVGGWWWVLIVCWLT